MEPQMNYPECGAPDAACEARYQECLTREFTDTGYGAVHHLTVATDRLQRSSRLTKEGWLYERDLLRDFLVENKPPEFIRKQNKNRVDSGKRSWQIADRNGVPKIDRTSWTSASGAPRSTAPTSRPGQARFCKMRKVYQQDE
jgi:hypothetical protein